MSTRRQILQIAPVAAVVASANRLPVMAVATDAKNRDIRYFGEPVTIVRAEEGGDCRAFDGWLDGRVYAPRNEAYERRVTHGLGPNHWDLLAYHIFGPADEAYYEARHPVIQAAYWDEEAIRDGRIQRPTQPHRVAHIGDPGEGIHRWAFPDEDWHGVVWKWQIGSVPPGVHFRWRDEYGYDHEHMWA